MFYQTTVSINYAYIGLTDVNASDFVWLDGSPVDYSNLSGKLFVSETASVFADDIKRQLLPALTSKQLDLSK